MIFEFLFSYDSLLYFNPNTIINYLEKNNSI